MASCAVLSCPSRKTVDKKTSGITFHKFPKEPTRRKSWVKFVNRGTWEPSYTSVICSKHFTAESFDRSSSLIVRLRQNAIPTMNKDHDNIGEPKVKIETDETFFENQNTMRFEGCWIESSGSSTDTASPVNDQTLDIYEAKENFETSELVDNKNFLEIGPGPSESCEQNFSVPFNVGATEVKIEVDESNESIAQILRLPFVPCTDTLETEVKTEPGLGVDESMPEVNDEGQDFKRDACSSFGEYVATELRSLPLEDRFQIQKEIQDCLSAAAVRHISKLGASESTKVHNLPS